jgi:DNA-binding transcriptional regulator of glucitol operon
MSMAGKGSFKKKKTQKRRMSPMFFFVLVVFMLLVITLAWVILRPPEGHPFQDTLGMRCEKIPDGNWTVSITGGRVKAADMKVVVVDQNTYTRTVNSRLTMKANDDFVYNDTNRNGMLDAGDTITLKVSSPNIKSGYRMNIMRGDQYWGHIARLPEAR